MGIEFVDQAAAIRRQIGRDSHKEGLPFSSGAHFYSAQSEAYRHWCEGWLQADGALPCPNIRTSKGGTSHWCVLAEQQAVDAAALMALRNKALQVLGDLLIDEDITDEKLRDASEGALPNLYDAFLKASPSPGVSLLALREAARAFVATVANVEATAEGKRLMEAVRGCER